MELWSAFGLGLIGSLHCAGMCGALALAAPGCGVGPAGFVVGRLAYNLGRITAYGLLGLVFGLIGQTAAMAGLQRWVSLLAGAALLLGLLPVCRGWLGNPTVKGVGWLKSWLGALLRQRGLRAAYVLGVVNGFLPCGLTYAACAGAVAAGSAWAAVGFMAAFGVGTTPMMLGIGLLGRPVQVRLRPYLQRMIPVALALMGALLIVRGLALDIPWLSPALGAGSGPVRSCH